MLLAGNIYRMDMRFEPPEEGVKYRPALVMYVDKSYNIALICKITTSKPSSKFPEREPIIHCDAAQLDEESWVQYNWYDTVDIKKVKYKYTGTLHNQDFARIFDKFITYHELVD